MTTNDLPQRLRAQTASDYLDGYGKRIVLEAASELTRLTTEREALFLAILGGEDAPGYAASLSVETVIDCHKQNTREMRDRAESAEAEVARLTRALDRAQLAEASLSEVLEVMSKLTTANKAYDYMMKAPSPPPTAEGLRATWKAVQKATRQALDTIKETRK